MDRDDTTDLVVITLLLNEARKCLDIISGCDEEDDNSIGTQHSTRTSISPEKADPEEGESDNAVDDYDYRFDDKFDEKFDSYYDKICHKSPEEFREKLHMSMDVFNLLYTLVKRDLRKYSNRPSVTPKCRLFITLVYLATGGSKQTISSLFDMPSSTAHKILSETCKILWKSLSDSYLSHEVQPNWKDISEQFETQLHLPNCVGAFDMRSIELRCPKKELLSYYQKKGKYCITILGACDANYKFTGVDVSVHEYKEDCETWSIGFEKKLIKGLLNLPKEKRLPNSAIKFPYYFIGDSLCPLKPHIMRSFPGKSLTNIREVFNSRMAPACLVIENTFGVLAARWKILTTKLILSPENMEHVLRATVLLHNFAQTHDSTYIPFEYVDRYEGDTLIRGHWRNEVAPLRKAKRLYSNNATQHAFKLRDTLCEYFAKNPISISKN